MTRRDRLYGRLDPVIATLTRWADDDPAAMRRLLTDEALRAQVLAALDDVVGEDAPPTGWAERVGG